MKPLPLPAPHVPGNTEAERMDHAVRMMFSVPKVGKQVLISVTA